MKATCILFFICLQTKPPLHSVELYLLGTVGSHKGVGVWQEAGTIKEVADLDYELLQYTIYITIRRDDTRTLSAQILL